MKNARWGLAATSLSTLGLLAACGGGGGGDAGTGSLGASALMTDTSVEVGTPHAALPETPAASKASSEAESYVNKPLRLPYSVLNVGIKSVTPSRIDATLYERSMMPNTALFGTAEGDIRLLDGRTLYLFVESGGLFKAAGGGVVTQPEPGVAVGLQGDILWAAGVRMGALQLWACLDVACNSRLRNVPYQVPYTVTVLRGYRLPGSDEEQIGVYDVQLPPATFGQPPPAGQLIVVPPERAPISSLTASVNRDPSGGMWGYDSPRQPTASVSDNGDGRARVTIQLPWPLPASLYTATVSMGTTHREGNNSAPPAFVVRFIQEVQEDPALPVLFDPPNLNLTVASNGTQGSTLSFQGVSGRNIATVSYEGVEYLFTPEQEALIPPGPRGYLLDVSQPSGWRPGFAFTQSIGARNCIHWWNADTSTSSVYCLPPGSYAFRLRYRMTTAGAGASSLHYLSGTIQVAP